MCCVSSSNAEDEAPEIVLVLKEWLPQPNGSYHLRSVFYIENFIHGFIIPQGRSVGTADAEVKVSCHIKCLFPAVMARCMPTWNLLLLGGC